MIHMFYKFSMDNGLISVKGDKLITTKRAPLFLKINDEGKYCMFLQYILNPKFLGNVSPQYRLKSFRKISRRYAMLI